MYWVVRLRNKGGINQQTYSRSHANGTGDEFLEDAYNHFSNTYNIPIKDITIADYNQNSPHSQGIVLLMLYWVVRLRSEGGVNQQTYSRSHDNGTADEFLEAAYNYFSNTYNILVKDITIANYDQNSPHSSGTII